MRAGAALAVQRAAADLASRREALAADCAENAAEVAAGVIAEHLGPLLEEPPATDEGGSVESGAPWL